jgi:hypothetical protein
MPYLNRVFEELGIHHEEHDVHAKVHKSLKDKAKKATAKNATAAAEVKKRKGAGASKVIGKKQKTMTTSITTSVHASIATSADDGEEVAENISRGSGSMATRMGGECSAASLDLWLMGWATLLLNPPLWHLCPVFWVMTLLAQRAKVLVVETLPHREKGRLLAWTVAVLRLFLLWRCLRTRQRHILQLLHSRAWHFRPQLITLRMLVPQMLFQALCIWVSYPLSLLCMVVCLLNFIEDLTYFDCFSEFDKGPREP